MWEEVRKRCGVLMEGETQRGGEGIKSRKIVKGKFEGKKLGKKEINGALRKQMRA